MYQATIDLFAELGRKKVNIIKEKPLSFFIGAAMAGGYIGFGIILIFSVVATIDPAWQKLIMGVSFGIALTLVVFAGAELFTGHTMYMTLSKLKGYISTFDLLKVWTASWTFNLVGSVLLAVLFVVGGGGTLLASGEDLLLKVASYKIDSSALSLIARGTLCNWLVCLALWMSARTNSDVAKAIVIFWCLFAFIASGYEHSVANMTLLTIALLAHPTETITIYGVAYNLLWVTLGNIIGGSLFVAMGYWWASGNTATQRAHREISDSNQLDAEPLSKTLDRL